MSSSSTTLPLSSLLLTSIPSHPLPHLLLDPVLTRLATIEALLVVSKPSSALKRLGASDQTVVGLISVLVVALLTRWRRQWRAVMMVLGLGEAVTRTLNLVERAQRTSKDEDEEDSNPATIPATHRRDDFVSEVQHLLSFWTLYVSLTFLESFRHSPSSRNASLLEKSPLTTRLRKSLRTLRHSYFRFLRIWILPLFYRFRYFYFSTLKNHPRFNLSNRLPAFPTVPFARQFAHLLTPRFPSSSTYRPPKPSTFPQPLPSTSELSKILSTLPFPHSYFASSSHTSRLSAESRWEFVKLLILWTGLRRDSFGAKSVLFDWVLGPVVRKFGGNDRIGIGRFDDGVEEYRVVKVDRRRKDGGGIDRVDTAKDEGERTTDHEPFPRSITPSPPQSSNPTNPTSPRQRERHHETPLSPRPSPIWTTQTPPRPTHSNRIARKPLSFDDEIDQHTNKFPAPENIPYRMSSTSHPLLQPYTVGSSNSSGSNQTMSSVRTIVSNGMTGTNSKTRKLVLVSRRRNGEDNDVEHSKDSSSLLHESPPQRSLNHSIRHSSDSEEDDHGQMGEEDESLSSSRIEFESPPISEAEQRWNEIESRSSPVNSMSMIEL